MPGAIEGVRVLDLSRDMAGSYACMLLGDMGAEVIRVEPVEGDPQRSEPTFQFWNRGRRSLALDIHSVDGRRVLERLIAMSDALVETFLAKEVRLLYLDYGTLSAINPQLIYCAVPPFGDTGPMAHLPANDGVVSAYTGIYGDQGGGEGLPPVFVQLPFVSYGAAFLAAFGVASALYTREMDGLGQKIEVPWYAGSIAMQSGSVVAGPNVTYWARGVRGQQGANPVYRLYRCQDDWLFIACGNVIFWNKLTIALGIEHLLEDPRYENAPWNIPLEHRQYLSDLIGGMLADKPRAYWLEYLESYDIPCAPIMTREQFVQHPQAVHNQMFVEIDDPVLGLTRQIGVPVKLSETPGEVGGPAPALGQDTQAILAELGYSAGDIGEMAARGIIKMQ
jgi:CoA:oxalate CoA-transferase